MNAYTIFFIAAMVISVICCVIIGLEMSTHLDKLVLVVLDSILIALGLFAAFIFFLLAVGSFIEKW